MFWTILAIYILVFILIPVWDAFVGFKEDNGDNIVWGNEYPPIFLFMILWPLFVPLFFIDYGFGKLRAIKKRRIEKEVREKNIRIAEYNEQLRIEKEQELALRQIDEELRREQQFKYMREHRILGDSDEQEKGAQRR